MTQIRNVAIIAHVDHGKTTLVDKILYQCNLFRNNQETKELILDNNELERERGITIISKNVSVIYKDVKINIIDTPGHADFGGEVERVLNMADGVLLLVDAFEGTMPQTRYVLQKAIELGLKPIVVINKVDKQNCKPEEVYESVFDLMFNLNASEYQLDFPVIYGSAKQGWMSDDWKNPTEDISILLDYIIKYIPSPPILEGSVQMVITNIDYSSYVGRIAIGRISRGIIKVGQQISLVKRDKSIVKSKVKELLLFEGLGRTKVNEVSCGDLCAVTGIENFDIGDTIADFDSPEGLPPIPIDEPTINMVFTINNSPFFGKEGKYVTSRHLRDRLLKETEKNLALRVEETGTTESFLVFGRGILHLSILIETMRREGYELQVGQPEVIIKEIDGKKCEPIEILSIDTPQNCSGKVIEAVNQKKGEMIVMVPKSDLVHLEFEIPARGLIGLRTNIMNLTAGEAIFGHRLKGFEPWKGIIPSRVNGVLIALETGKAIPYALDKLQDRGSFFVNPGEDIYAGQIIGENTRSGDICLNITKTKKLTNMRASGSDEKAKIFPAVKFSLEEALEYIQKDEYVEITPKNLRLRKILLGEIDRKRMSKIQS